MIAVNVLNLRMLRKMKRVQKMSRKHYHVLYGLKGCYMPDLNMVAASKRQAIAMARTEAKIQNAYYAENDYREQRLKQHGSGYYSNRLFSITVTDACYDAGCMCDA